MIDPEPCLLLCPSRIPLLAENPRLEIRVLGVSTIQSWTAELTLSQIQHRRLLGLLESQQNRLIHLRISGIRIRISERLCLDTIWLRIIRIRLGCRRNSSREDRSAVCRWKKEIDERESYLLARARLLVTMAYMHVRPVQLVPRRRISLRGFLQASLVVVLREE